MSKFNVNANESRKSQEVTTKNKSGVTAFAMDNKLKLITQVLTTFFNESKFYGDNSKELVKLVKEILDTDPKFVANLAIYARNVFHLRSVSHVLVGELAHHSKGKQYVRKTIEKVVERPDDMVEILGYYISTYGKPIPNSMKKGLADAFARFDEYSLAKYDRTGKAIALRDILCIAHPTPKDSAQEKLWKKVLESTLETPITWETQLSTRGNTKEVWEDLISGKKLGYMAALRNLRNMIKSGASNINNIYEMLSNEERVLKNKQLPFRYYNAYRMLKNENLGTSKVYDTLEKAIRASTKNITKLPGKTFISADVSGSMTGRISTKSDTTCAEIAVLLMSIANYICEETITTTFDTGLYPCNLSTTNGILANADSIRAVGGGTDITQPILYLLKNKIKVDRIIMLSDNEINSGFASGSHYYGRYSNVTCQDLVQRYRNEVNPDVWVHAIDLQGYGTQQFNGKKTNIIAGWSERVLDFISMTEEGMDNILNKVAVYYFK
jgi:hypothetical protein